MALDRSNGRKGANDGTSTPAMQVAMSVADATFLRESGRKKKEPEEARCKCTVCVHAA